MSSSSSLFSLLAVLVASAVAFRSAGYGPGFAGGGENYESPFVQAGRKPNDTAGAGFYDPNLGYWIWRVNISNVAIPDSNEYAANAQYDLQWPFGGTLQSYLKQFQGEGRTDDDETDLCAYFSVFTLPQNITGRYMQSFNGNYSALLGDRCARSLSSSLLGPSCQAGPVDNLDGCSDTLNIAPGFTTAYVLGNATRSIPNTTHLEPGVDGSIYPGDAIFHLTSEPLPAGNLSNYLEAERKLYILGLAGPSVDGSAFRIPMCQVVNTTAAATAEVTTTAATAEATTAAATAEVSAAPSPRIVGGLFWSLMVACIVLASIV